MTRDLIVFGEDWGAHPTSTQHLVSRLARDRLVLWVNSVGMRRPRFSVRDARRIAQKVKSMARPLRGPTPNLMTPKNLTVIEPRVLPLPNNAIAAVFNRAVGARKIAAAADAAGLTDPAIWVSVPTAVDLLPALPKAPIVYYCGDDFGGLAGVDHEPVLSCERRLGVSAKKIFTVSDALSLKFRADKVVELPHGVDYDLFSTPETRATDLPQRGPVAGFYGSISAWLDQRLIAEVATQLDDWAFVFIGRVECDVDTLRQCPNVRFLGPRAHSQLPGYVQHWNASLLPFLDNRQIRACNPLKLREYLAAGTPVVSTPFPAVKAYASFVEQAPDAARFVSALRRTLENTDQEARAARMASVANESWERRAKDAAKVVDAL